MLNLQFSFCQLFGKVGISLWFVPAKAKLPYYRKLTMHFISTSLKIVLI